MNPQAFAFERVDFDADDARNIGILGTFIRMAAKILPRSLLVRDSKKLSSQSLLEGDRLFSIMHGDGGVGVIVGRVRIRDLAEEFFALDDVQSHSFAGRRENAEHHIVFRHDDAQRQRLILGHTNEMAGLVCETSQFFKIDHTHTPRNTPGDSRHGMLTEP